MITDSNSQALSRAQRILQRRLPHLPEEYLLAPLPGDASTRDYFRLSLPGVAGYTTAVLMVFDRPFRLERSDYFQVSELMRKINLPVPAIYDVFERDGAMLIEDLGDMTLYEMVPILNGDREALREYYQRAIDSLIVLQTRASHYSGGMRAFERAFDEKKLLWELRFTVLHFARWLINYRPGRAAARTLKGFFADLSRRIAALPRILCHRDYHSRNLMIRRDRLFIIDFQDARMGPHVYDLVSLLGDSYTELPDELVRQLLGYYASNHPSFGTADPGHLRDQLNLVALQRHLKHLGTFGYQASVGRRQYLRFVPLTLRYLERNFGNFPEYEEASAVLGDLFNRSRERLKWEGLEKC